MEIILLVILCMPFLFALISFFANRISAKSFPIYGVVVSTIYLLFISLGMVVMPYSSDGATILEWGSSNYLGLSFIIKEKSREQLFIIIGAILLVFTTYSMAIRFNKFSQEITRGQHCFVFLLTGLANGAIAAGSFYTFFVFVESIMFFYYIYYGRREEKGIGISKVISLLSSLAVVIALIYIDNKTSGSSGFITSATVSNAHMVYSKPLILWIFITYFLIKLSIFLGLSWNRGSGDDGMIEPMLFSNLLLIALIHGFDKCVTDIPMEILSVNIFYVAAISLFIYFIKHAFAIGIKDPLQQQFAIRSGTAVIMMGALASMDKDISAGVYVLLVSHIFAFLAFNLLVNDRPIAKNVASKLFVTLLIIASYSLILLPISGGFVGFYKIMIGYAKISSYFLLFFVGGMIFSFVNVTNMLIKLADCDVDGKNSNNKLTFPVLASMCLSVVVILGVKPSLLDVFLHR